VPAADRPVAIILEAQKIAGSPTLDVRAEAYSPFIGERKPDKLPEAKSNQDGECGEKNT
jgi:hypothetical protein